ncbi:DUF3429 domain-containing protein [Roseomonas sp. KE2513]|uniref:DUF3429 domain-containing protein n=1 Tax=Roseomonas sp. KE2513 TaxID=2479202 RepID=UPI0018DF6178|nr:DUF3429 domain-containing protein [Roseomonas sp. KE2513]MBI0536101.1 DUF3429 domain-containing protein [Roseomonas sp. KE2513]
MPDTLPSPARILGPAGLIPFAGLVLLAALWPQGRPVLLVALLAYGATIAAFLGAVHWGLALRPAPGEEGAAWGRLGLGVVPALLAWVALLAPLPAGLAGLAALLLATAAVESLAARRGLVPAAYLRLRWVLSLGAGACLLVGAALA